MTYKKNDSRIVAFAADIKERLEEISMGYDENAINKVARHIFIMADDHGDDMNYHNFTADMAFALCKYVGMDIPMIRELGDNNFKIMFTAWKLRKKWIF